MESRRAVTNEKGRHLSLGFGWELLESWRRRRKRETPLFFEDGVEEGEEEAVVLIQKSSVTIHGRFVLKKKPAPQAEERGDAWFIPHHHRASKLAVYRALQSGF